MVKITCQSVALVNPVFEEQLLCTLGIVLGTPYNKGSYDLEKTKLVAASCHKKGHDSVFEHLNITVSSITNIGTYKDLTRHRHSSFTIESTSFCKYNDLIVILAAPEDTSLLNKIHDTYMMLKQDDVKKARDYLPQCTAARMIMTTNIREWWHVVKIRHDPNDNPLTIEWASLTYSLLSKHYPFFFKDLLDDPTRN